MTENEKKLAAAWERETANLDEEIAARLGEWRKYAEQTLAEAKGKYEAVKTLANPDANEAQVRLAGALAGHRGYVDTLNAAHYAALFGAALMAYTYGDEVRVTTSLDKREYEYQTAVRFWADGREVATVEFSLPTAKLGPDDEPQARPVTTSLRTTIHPFPRNLLSRHRPPVL